MAHPTYAFLINPASGSVTPARIKALHQAINERGLDAEVILASHNIEEQTQRLRDAGYRAIIAGGGDGTLRAVAAALAGTPTAFGVLPWGTFNHFAKDLGVPGKLSALFDALEQGRTRKVDTGQVNGHLFLNNAVLGVYPKFVAEREKIQPKLGKFPAAALVSVKLFFQHRAYRLTLVVDGKEQVRTTPLVFIGNNDYQLDRLGLPGRQKLDGGKLCVYVLRTQGRVDLAKLTWNTLLGTARDPRLFEEFNPTSLKIDAPRTRSLLVALDGEVERMRLPLTVKLECRSLKLIGLES